MHQAARSLLALAIVLGLPACAGTANTSATVAQASPDNAAIAIAFAGHRSRIEVTALGRIVRVLTDEASEAGTHQRFILALTGPTQTVLVTNNVSIGRRVPIAVGDTVLVHGEYVWNTEGGLVHFTHHDPQRTHEGGWIERDGIRYE